MEPGSSKIVGSTGAPVGVLQTQVDEVKRSFKWSIKDFLERPEKVGECIHSPIFSAGDGLTKWCFRMYPRDTYESLLKVRTLFVDVVESKKTDVMAKWRIGIMKANGEVTNLYETSPDFSFKRERGFVYACLNFINLDELKKEKVDLLPDGVLTIVGDIIEDIYESVIISDQTKEVKVVSDLQNLLDSQRLSDVVLVVAGKELKAHKAVLAARSSVFAAMFEHDMNEKKMNRVEITDVEPDVMEEILNYIYTGQVKRLIEISRGLFQAADKYDLQELKILCENAISKGLSVKNASEILILADRHSAKHLKDQTVQFIIKNSYYVFKSQEWKQLTLYHDSVISDVVRALPRSEVPYVISGPPAKKPKCDEVTDDDDGDESDGDEGSGDENYGYEGNGHEGNGDEDDGDEGNDDEGSGDEDDGDEDDGDEDDGDEHDGDEHDGDEGNGDEDDGDEDDGDEGNDDEDDGHDGGGNNNEIEVMDEIEVIALD